MNNVNKTTITSLALFAVLATGLSANTYAMPTSAQGTVVSGSATIVDTDAVTTTINQISNLAEINWTDFDIASGETVHFNLPTASALSVNRVLSGTASTIAGNLTSNGQVYLINEQGITFTGTSFVDMPTFMASTIDSFNGLADAQQYAEIKFVGSDFGNVDKMVVISPYIAFEASGLLDLSNVKEKLIYAVNTVNVTADASQNITVDLPDAQADIDVPDGKTLGIKVENIGSCSWGCSYGTADMSGERLEMIAKAVSIQDNMESLIQLGDSSISVSGFDPIVNFSQKSTDPLKTAIHIESDGDIQFGGQILFQTIDKDLSYQGGNYDVKFIAGGHLDGNLYSYQGNIVAGDLYVEADSIRFSINSDGPSRIVGKRTFVQREGTLRVVNDTGFGYIHGNGVDIDFFRVVNKAQGFDQYYFAPTVELRAPNVEINASINHSLATDTMNTYRSTFYSVNSCNWFCFKTPVMPSSPDLDTNDINIYATETVTINNDILLNGLGSVNVEAATLTIDPSITATTDPVVFTQYTPPPPPPPPVVPVTPPAEVPEPTFDDLVENIDESTVEVVVDKFFERFTEAVKETAKKQMNSVKASTPKSEAASANNNQGSGASHSTAVEATSTAVAATCVDGVCTAVDKENNMVVVNESYLREQKLDGLVDRVVNLKGLENFRF